MLFFVINILCNGYEQMLSCTVLLTAVYASEELSSAYSPFFMGTTQEPDNYGRWVPSSNITCKCTALGDIGNACC